MLLAATVAGAGCRSSPEDVGLLDRESQAYAYRNEIRRLEELRAQYAEQRETLEILLSEIDRERQIAAGLERDLAQAQGRVAALQAQLQAEQQKEKAVREEMDKAKSPPSPPPSGTDAKPPETGGAAAPGTTPPGKG